MNGLTVARVAATSPAARDTSSRPHRYVIGITMVPSRADSDRRPTSPVPNTLAHSHATMKYSGGVVSLTWTWCSIAPNDRPIKWTVAASSSQ